MFLEVFTKQLDVCENSTITDAFSRSVKTNTFSKSAYQTSEKIILIHLFTKIAQRNICVGDTLDTY